MRTPSRPAERSSETSENRHSGFQTLDEFQRRYFPLDFQIAATVDSSEAVRHQVSEESAGMIKAAFAETR